MKFDNRIERTFPYGTAEKQELSGYLNFAYIGGRYHSGEEFPVTKKRLVHWGKEAKKRLYFTETFSKERIECLIKADSTK